MKPNYLEPEFSDAYTQWQTNDNEDTRAGFLKTVAPLVEKNVYGIAKSKNPLLLSQGRQLALQALRSYDPSKAKFTTHLYGQMQGLRRIKQKQEQILSMPQRIALENYNLLEAEKELSHELGRDPTDSEIADRYGISPKRIEYLRQYHSGASEGQLESGHTISVQDPLKQQSMVMQLVYHDLDPYHQKIMEYTLGMNGRKPLSNSELAIKLKRSPGAISQAKKRIQDILAKMEDIQHLL